MVLSRTFLLPVCAALVFAAPMFAQNGDALATAMANNVKLLHQYTFKMKAEVVWRGQGRMTRVSQIHFTPDGKREATVISQDPPPDQVATGLGSRIINQKRQELKEYGDKVTQLVEEYLPPDPEKLRAALKTAELGGSGNSVSLVMKDYLKKGDALSVVFDPNNRKLQRFELKTQLDKDPIDVVSDLKSIPNGPTYPAQTKVKAPAKNLEVDMTQYDFEKQ